MSVRVPRCQKLQMTAYPGLAQDALWLYPYGNSGRQRVNICRNTVRLFNVRHTDYCYYYYYYYSNFKLQLTTVTADAVTTKTLQGHTAPCQQVCNRHAEYSARHDKRPAEVSRSLKTRPEEKGLQFLTKRRQWRSGSEEGKPFHALDAAMDV